MLTKEQMVEAIDFIEKAYTKYLSDKSASLIRNYMLGHNELNDFLMMKDLAYSGFIRYGRIEADFISALRTLRNEIRNQF